MNKRVINLPVEIRSCEQFLSAKIILRVAPVIRDRALGASGPWDIAWSADLVPSSSSILAGGAYMAISCKPRTMSGRSETPEDAKRALRAAEREFRGMWEDNAALDNAQIQYIEGIVRACDTFFPDSKDEG